MGVKYSNKGTLLFLDDFYLEYSYSGIRKEEFYELFYDRIFKLLHDIGYKGIYDENYMIIKKRLGSIISTEMYGYLHNKMCDWNECVQIIRNYFVSIYPNNGTLKDKIKCFDYLDEFLNNCDFNIDPDTTSLIYSSIDEISNAVSFIYSKNEKAIKKGKLDSLFSSVILKTLIEVHMIENNISVLDDDNVDEYYNDLSLRDICEIYISDIKNANLYRKNELFSDEEERDLIRKAQNGDNEARDMFIYNNLRLVFRVARKYVNKGVPLLDLVQEGNMGLLSALERFDLSKNFRFSTYAYVWIKSYISKYVRCNCRNIRIPEDLYYKVQLYKDTELAFYSKNGRKPTLEEIASLMNISVNDAKRARQAREDTVSLNAVIGEDKNTELGDFISQEDTNMNEVINSDLPLLIQNLINKANLDYVRRRVLELKYGLNGNRIHSFREISEELNITRQRAKQIEVSALKMLRKAEGVKKLAVYMDREDEAIENVQEYNYRNTRMNNVTVAFSEEEKKYAYSIKKGNASDVSIFETLKEPKISEVIMTLTVNRYVGLLYEIGFIDGDFEPFMDSSCSAKILDVLSLPLFDSVIEKLTVKGFMAICLKYGYVNGIKYSNAFIARTLGISEEDVIKLCKKILVDAQGSQEEEMKRVLIPKEN